MTNVCENSQSFIWHTYCFVVTMDSFQNNSEQTQTANAEAGVKQGIFGARRRYNKWVADETLEDYALRFTDLDARKWSASRVAITALGSMR
jgi:hypothetical protein